MNIKIILKACFIILGMALLASGCTKEKKTDILIELGNDPEQVKLYRKDMQHLSKEIEENQPNYRHLPLKEDNGYDWFYIETYALWEKRVSKNQFIQNGLQRYPAYKESLEYIADQLTK